MTVWLDAQFPPALAPWIEATFGIECRAPRDLGLREAEDSIIFEAARTADVVIMTKDRDFLSDLDRLGPPPRVFWSTCGNTSNARLRTTLPAALILLERGEALVEISDPPVAPPEPG